MGRVSDALRSNTVRPGSWWWKLWHPHVGQQFYHRVVIHNGLAPEASANGPCDCGNVRLRSAIQTAMKTQLRKGDAKNLKTHSVGSILETLTESWDFHLPSLFASDDKDDGVVIPSLPSLVDLPLPST